MKVLTSEAVFLGHKTITISAEITEGLYSDLLKGYELGLKNGAHNLTVEEFMGMCVLGGAERILNIIGVKTE